jgi:NADPH:quinone reductase
MREHRRLEEMRPLFESKQVRPVIDTVLPLEEWTSRRVDKAHERLGSHHGREKIALQVGIDR